MATTMTNPSIRPNPLSGVQEFQKRAPINVVRIAEALGLKVYEDELPPGISGKIIKDPLPRGGAAGYSIIANIKEATTRKRFTIAHEISHFILHRDQIGDGLTDDALYRSGLSTVAEVRANKLAADILMPFVLIEEEIKKGATSIRDLANIFQVSIQAMSVRLGIPT